MDNSHTHFDGWTTDETFRSMRHNCEAYKKKCQEVEQLHKVIDNLEKENASLKKELGIEGNELKTWNDYIIHICRDGQQRTAREIFNIIDKMDKKPFPPEAKTPASTCGSICGTLFTKNKLCKTNDSPIKYFTLLS